MVKINNVFSLLVAASFVAAKPFESAYKIKYCKDLDVYLNSKNAVLALCSDTNDFKSVIVETDNVKQDIVDKINTYNGVLDLVTFEKVSTVQKNLNLKSLKAKALYFDNKHYNGDKKEIYIPKNVLKSAKTVTTISLENFNLSQKNLNEITSLTQLKELYLDGITADPDMDFSKLKNLKNLSTLVLSTITQKGDEGDDIEYLDEVPESVCQLKKLNYLCIYRNDITYLPKCLANLKNLERLDIRLNDIKSIPRAIRKMPNLEIIRDD